MFRHSVDELTRWMLSTKMEAGLAYLVRDYLLARGGKQMSQCLPDRASKWHLLATQHDKLGWDNFLEGQICVLYLKAATALLPSRRSPTKWGAQFISKLLQISHKQWLV